MRGRQHLRCRLARYGFTERQAAAVAVVLPVGAGAVAAALLGRVAPATALIAVLVTGAALASVQAHRRTAADRQVIRNLQVVVEETQRRLMVVAEHERVAAADRHQRLIEALENALRPVTPPSQPQARMPA
jgi:hypothetical protein